MGFLSSLSPQVWGWLLFAIVMMVIEALTVSLTSIWMAAGGLAAAVTALVTERFLLQLTVCAVVSLLLLAVTRPLARRLLNRRTVKTNVEALVGQEAVITQPVRRMEYGEAKVHGQLWSASLDPASAEVEPGDVVRIKAVEGVRLIVEKES